MSALTALIDGDLAAYRAAAATQQDIDWGEGDVTSQANPEEAAKAAIYTINLWIEQAGASKALVCLTGRGNFRKSVFASYKSNRSSKPRPLALQHVQEAIRGAFPTATVDGLEADDLLGLALTSPQLQGRSVCVTLDKDLRGVPGLHLNPSKQSLPEFVTEMEANKFWMTQALTGDPSDGYPGCKAIGPKKAERILADWDGADLGVGYDLVLGTFLAKSTDQPGDVIATDTADQMLRVSRILRYGDYDKANRKVRLWHPTTPEWLALPQV